MMLCVCILVCLCACICPHMYVCEHMCLLICIWWCRFGVDDGFGIMVLSGCREYVTEPVDVVLVVTGRVLYVVGWAAAYYVRCCGGGLCWGASSMIDSVDGSG